MLVFVGMACRLVNKGPSVFRELRADYGAHQRHTGPLHHGILRRLGKTLRDGGTKEDSRWSQPDTSQRI